MDLLLPFLQIFKSKEQTAFRGWLANGNDKRRVVFVKLFDLLLEGTKQPAEIAQILHKSPSTVQLAKTRSRLRQFAEEFLPGYYLTEDIPADELPRRYLVLAEIALRRNSMELVRHYLEEAELEALKFRKYDVLQSIYRTAIIHARALKLDVHEYIKRWKINSRRYAIYSEVLMLLAETEYAVDQWRLFGIPFDAEEVLNRIEQIDLDREEANDPAILYAIARLVRAAILPSKYYRKLHRVAERFHHRLEKAGQFREGDREYKIGFLYMLSHVYFRIRSFELAEQMLKELTQQFAPGEFIKHPLYTKVYSLETQLFSYTRRAALSSVRLERVIEQPSKFADSHERLNMQLNLSVAWFHQTNFKRADEVLRGISGSRDKLIRHYGTEWLYKKDMIQAIVLFELTEFEQARYKLAQMRTAYEPFLNQPYYQRALRFMNVVLVMMDNPGIERTPAFHEQVKSAGLAFGDKEDLQAITFYCWLKSKMDGLPYYEVLMTRLAEIDPDFSGPEESQAV